MFFLFVLIPSSLPPLTSVKQLEYENNKLITQLFSCGKITFPFIGNQTWFFYVTHIKNCLDPVTCVLLHQYVTANTEALRWCVAISAPPANARRPTNNYYNRPFPPRQRHCHWPWWSARLSTIVGSVRSCRPCSPSISRDLSLSILSFVKSFHWEGQ